MSVSQIIASVFLVAGFIFLAIGVIGVISFPGFNTRLHASGVGETLGTMLMVIGMIILLGFSITSAKLIIMFVILLLTNPLGAHVILMEAISATDYHGYNKKRIVGKIEDDKEAEEFLAKLRDEEVKESEHLKEFLSKIEKEQ